MSTPLRLAIDFDQVVHNPFDKEEGYKLGKPILGAPEALRQLHEAGAIIVIHSVWADTQQRCKAMADWCEYFKVPYDFVTNQKPDCDIFLDDRALRFEGDWSKSLQQIQDIAKLIGK